MTGKVSSGMRASFYRPLFQIVPPELGRDTCIPAIGEGRFSDYPLHRKRSLQPMIRLGDVTVMIAIRYLSRSIRCKWAEWWHYGFQRYGIKRALPPRPRALLTADEGRGSTT